MDKKKKIILATVLLLGVIPCETAAFTLYKNERVGEIIALTTNLLVCIISSWYFVVYLFRKNLYETIAVKYTIFFILQIFLNIIGSMHSMETDYIAYRTMSMVCLWAYYMVGIYFFQETDSLLKSLNLLLFLVILVSIILYGMGYKETLYIENATRIYFKGIVPNRNSYGEITLLYITTNMYLWGKNKRFSIFYILTSVIALYTTYQTHSATLSICVIVLIILCLFYKITKFTIPFKGMLIVYIVVFIGLIVMQSENVPFLKSIIMQFGKELTLTGRTNIWEAYIESINESLFLGRGFDAPVVQGIYYIDDPHNSILYILFTQGICGLLLFCYMLYNVVSKARKKNMKNNDLCAYMYIFITVWLIRGLVESIFSYSHYVFWIALIIMEREIIDNNFSIKKSELNDSI